MRFIAINSKRINEYLIFALAVISCIAIAQGDTTLVPSIVPVLFRLLNYAISFICLVYIISHNNTINRYNVRRISVVLIWFLYKNLNVYAPESNDIEFLFFILLVVFSLQSNETITSVFQLYKKFLVLISCIGIITYFCFILNINLPYRSDPFYDDNTSAIYINYYLSYILYESAISIRLCGLFNEPGFFGTILGLFCIIQKKHLFSKENIVLFVAGVLTFSLAFYAIIFIGLACSMFNSIRKTIVVTLSMALLLGIVYYNSNENIAYFLRRFEYDKTTHSFSGSNRKSTEFEVKEREFALGNSKMFGYGSGYLKNVDASSTYKKYIIEWGYLGFFLTYGMLILIAFKECRGKDSTIYLLCFAASIFQRPIIFTVAYFLVLFGGIQYIINSQTPPTLKTNYDRRLQSCEKRLD